jgi:flagellar basal-body rod protein FlgB
VDPTSAIMITKALDGLWARSLATAQNVANANSPGYRPVRVSFEEALQSAARQGPEALRSVTAKIGQAPAGTAGTEMRLDLELATASETGMRYAALLDLLGRQLQISHTVVRGGQ